jgi:hypothetical protein
MNQISQHLSLRQFDIEKNTFEKNHLFLNHEETNKNREFFEKEIPSEAVFKLTKDDWFKLKTLQHKHRFLKGEWEDFFIGGLV